MTLPELLELKATTGTVTPGVFSVIPSSTSELPSGPLSSGFSLRVAASVLTQPLWEPCSQECVL